MQRSATWRWTICGLLLLATMLNYMDRQTLSLLARRILFRFNLDEGHLGRIEGGFGYAFAVGGLFFGFVADKVSVRWLYPFVLTGWSLAGILTAYAVEIGPAIQQIFSLFSTAPAPAPYYGFLGCRVLLGFFEAGHWPCALVTTQAILSRQDRPLGNSILQSGASVGAMITPFVVLALVPDLIARWTPALSATTSLTSFVPGSEFALTSALARAIDATSDWRRPFVIVGFAGMAWIIPWLFLIRESDLVRREEAPTSDAGTPTAQNSATTLETLIRRFFVLIVIVVTINMSWHFYRAWLPLYLEKSLGYSVAATALFVSAYYISTDLGCLAVGFAVKAMTRRGGDVHQARVVTFGACVVLMLLSIPAATMPAGWPLIATLLGIGAAALGMFPNYYAFTQELSNKHQGKITGILSFTTWTASAMMHPIVGDRIKEHNDYASGFWIAGLGPMLGLVLLLLLWGRASPKPTAEK